MTEEFTIGIIIALSIGQLVAWIGYWHWRSEAKYLRMMWQNEHEMNTALFGQVRELERPKVFQADSAKIAQLSEEEREAKDSQEYRDYVEKQKDQMWEAHNAENS